MKIKMYKFSHIGIYSGDDEEKSTANEVKPTGRTVD